MSITEYELTILCHETLNVEQVKEIEQQAQGLIEEAGGTILHQMDLGKRPMAYEIDHQKKATYIYYNFCAAPTDLIQKIQRMCRLSEGVIRFLTVRVNDDVDVAARQADLEKDVQRLQQYYGLAVTKASANKVMAAAEKSA